MAIATWSDAYLTGDATVDDQHRHLFAIINDLHTSILAGRGKTILGKTLASLADYALRHFDAEERLMEKASYPRIIVHKGRHAELAARTTELAASYESGKLVMTISLSQFLSDWFRHHINEEDKALIDWLKAQKESNG